MRVQLYEYLANNIQASAFIIIEEREFLYRKQMNGVCYHNIFPHYFFNEKYGNCHKVFHKLLTRLRRKMKSFYKYTDKQREIVSLCKKYSKVHCSFDTMDGRPVARLYIEPNWDRDDFVPYSEVEEWLKTNCELKQVGRPKGSKFVERV